MRASFIPSGGSTRDSGHQHGHSGCSGDLRLSLLSTDGTPSGLVRGPTYCRYTPSLLRSEGHLHTVADSLSAALNGEEIKPPNDLLKGVKKKLFSQMLNSKTWKVLKKEKKKEIIFPNS